MYCTVLESLKKNDKIKDFVINVLREKTENDRTVASILKIMSEKYERTMSEKCLNLMEEIVNFKTEGGIENTADRFGKMMAEVKKMDLAANLNFALTLQFRERLEKNGKLSSDEKMRLKDEIETKEGKPKYIHSDERVQKELRRMKILSSKTTVCIRLLR